MTQSGPLERIATALETIAAVLVGTPVPAAHVPRRPDLDDARFAWEPDTEPPVGVSLPEPAPAEERCGFLIERYVHPLDRATLIYQISKSGATILVNEHEAARLAALDDAQFTTDMAGRLAEALAQRHREARAATPEPDAAPSAPSLPTDASDEERERAWAAQA